MAFAKAIKKDAKGRVALIGPSGSGKSYTMLTLARALAGPEGKIAAIDTEHGSLSKYADLFDFDSDEPSLTSADYFLKQLDAAEQVACAIDLLEVADEALALADESEHAEDIAGWRAACKLFAEVFAPAKASLGVRGSVRPGVQLAALDRIGQEHAPLPRAVMALVFACSWFEEAAAVDDGNPWQSRCLVAAGVFGAVLETIAEANRKPRGIGGLFGSN